MAQPNPTAEPSMEEILASIRRIISDEHSDQAEEAVAAPAAAEAVAEDNAAPIPIADTIEDAPVFEEPVSAAAPVSDEPMALDAPVSDMADLPSPASAPQDDVAEEPVELDVPPAPAPSFDDDALPPLELTEEAALPESDPVDEEPLVLDAPMEPAEGFHEQLTDTALAELPSLPSGLLEPETDAAVASGFKQLEAALASRNKSLEDITDEVLRPMVKTWLDDNLPQLVERLVREEIQRVARGN
ncbi:MAG: DUF2497 domain-containing protein [Pseudomonadota bacterium]